MARTMPFYPPEFKVEAVQLVQQHERSLPQIARDLGVSDQTLRNWVKQIESNGGAQTGLTTEERDELHRITSREPDSQRGTGHPKKSGSLLRQREHIAPLAAFVFIEAEKANHAVSLHCRVLGVSRRGFYAWRGRPLCARAEANQMLQVQIRAIHTRSRGPYGTPRIHAELRGTGVRCGRKRIARLLRVAGLAGGHRRKGTTTTRRGAETLPAADRVQRNFTATAPNRLSCRGHHVYSDVDGLLLSGGRA